MNLDIEKIKKIMSINIEQLTKDDLKTYIRELAQYIAYIKGVKINISFDEIEDTEIAKCYTSTQLSNNQITTYYNINFCLKKFNKPGAFDNESIKQIPIYVRLIKVISHEIEHAVQKEDIIKNSWLPNANSISIAKESLCGFQNYYWDKLKGEFNAEIEGWKMTLDILLQLGLENDYSYIINKCITSLIEQEQTVQIEAIVNEEKTILPTQQMVTLFASEYIKRNPELLKYNPCLRFVYNSNGIKKNFDELMSDKIALLEKTKNMNYSQEQKEKIIAYIEQQYREIINCDLDLLKKSKTAKDEYSDDEMVMEEEFGKAVSIKRPKIKTEAKRQAIRNCEKEQLLKEKQKLIILEEEQKKAKLKQMEQEELEEENDMGMSR